MFKLSSSEQAEVYRIQNVLGSLYEGAKVRTTRKIAKTILLNDWFTYDGRFCYPEAKHIGLGVYEISVRKE